MMKRPILIWLAFMLASLPLKLCAAPAPEITRTEYLHEIACYLYWWYLDERDAEKLVGKDEIVFWVREMTPRLDPGDKSLFGQIVIPELEAEVTVKKADYSIPELGVTVKSSRFKVTGVSRPGPKQKPQGAVVIKTDYRALKEYAHRRRGQVRFPGKELLARFEAASAEAIRTHLEGGTKAGLENRIGAWEVIAGQPQVLHLAPLLELSNETWAFWETGRMLFRFSSDIDLEHPAVWEHNDLVVDAYAIDEQTVVSLDEVAGSNAYMTRDQVGRILFNCVVHGKRLSLDLTDIDRR